MHIGRSICSQSHCNLCAEFYFKLMRQDCLFMLVMLAKQRLTRVEVLMDFGDTVRHRYSSGGLVLVYLAHCAKQLWLLSIAHLCSNLLQLTPILQLQKRSMPFVAALGLACSERKKKHAAASVDTLPASDQSALGYNLTGGGWLAPHPQQDTNSHQLPQPPAVQL